MIIRFVSPHLPIMLSRTWSYIRCFFYSISFFLFLINSINYILQPIFTPYYFTGKQIYIYTDFF